MTDSTPSPETMPSPDGLPRRRKPLAKAAADEAALADALEAAVEAEAAAPGRTGRRRGLGQREGEGRTPLHLSFGPDAAAVTLNDALHQGQPHPGAFKFLLPVQPLKHPE